MGYTPGSVQIHHLSEVRFHDTIRIESHLVNVVQKTLIDHEQDKSISHNLGREYYRVNVLRRRMEAARMYWKIE